MELNVPFGADSFFVYLSFFWFWISERMWSAGLGLGLLATTEPILLFLFCPSHLSGSRLQGHYKE
jgi:hypothetical protein